MNNNQQPPKGQELQVVKEAVNLGIANLQFEEKEKAIHCFRTIQVQLQQFEQLKQTNAKLGESYDKLSLDYQELRSSVIKVEGKPAKVLTK